MGEANESADSADRPSKLEMRVQVCEAAARAQMIMIKALIATHPDLDLLHDAFLDLSEGAVSRALGSSATTDTSIAAFEHFRDEWLRMLMPRTG
jgi:hypothetical protein